MLFKYFDEFVFDEGNASKDEGEDAMFDINYQRFVSLKRPQTGNIGVVFSKYLHQEYGGVLLFLLLLLVGTSWRSDWST